MSSAHAPKIVPIRAARKPGTPEPEVSPETLAHAAAAGDPDAIGRLFDRLHEPVAAFLSRMIGPGPDAEDLVQATFLAIVRGKARYDGRSAARTWVLGIAANLARRHLRTRARRARLRRVLAWTRQPAMPDVESVAETRREVERVEAALRVLPVAQREALLLCELHGLSAREAAAALGTSEAAVWRRVSRARGAIRATLSTEGEVDNG